MRSDSTQQVAERDPHRQVAEAIRRGQRHHHQAMVSKSRGHRDLVRQELRRAVEAFTEAVRIDPHHTSAYLLRARVLEELGEDGLAEADLATVQRLADTH